MYVSHKFLRVVTLCLLILSSASCGPRHAPADSVDVVINNADDVKKLREQEKKNAIVPATYDKSPYIQLLNGVEVETLPAYRIGPGDVLELVYHIEYKLNENIYQLEVQDKVNVWFPFHPQFSSTVVIRSDGRISLPLIGDVSAAGMTTEQLTALLCRRYGKFIRNPSITVSLQEFNVKIEELKRTITTAPRGQSRIAPVAPDGRIAVPILGNIQAAGYTLTELESIINRDYKKYINNLHTTLVLNEIHFMKFYAAGEFVRPGVYELKDRTNILDVLALGGGFTPEANLEEVLVFRNNGLKKPVVFMVNIKSLLEEGKYLAELDIQPADIIYLPKGWLDNANDLIAKIFTKGIYGILPFQSNFTVGYDLLKEDNL